MKAKKRTAKTKTRKSRQPSAVSPQPKAKTKAKKSRQPKPKTKAKKTRGPSPAQKSAITRARNRIASAPKPRTKAQKIAHAANLASLKGALLRSGQSSASVAIAIGWISRQGTKTAPRKRPPAGPRPKTTKRQKAVSAALKGVVTRATAKLAALGVPKTKKEKAKHADHKAAAIRALEKIGKTPAQIRAILGWQTRRARLVRLEIAAVRNGLLGAPLDGTNRDDWHVLHAHLATGSARFRRFVRYCEDQGMSYDEAVDEWFSPEGE